MASYSESSIDGPHEFCLNRNWELWQESCPGNRKPVNLLGGGGKREKFNERGELNGDGHQSRLVNERTKSKMGGKYDL